MGSGKKNWPCMCSSSNASAASAPPAAAAKPAKVSLTQTLPPLLKIPGAAAQFFQQVREVLQRAHHDVNHALAPFEVPLGRKHHRVPGSLAMAFPNLLPHHQVHVAGFVFQRKERNALGGAGPLPQQYE